MSKLTVACNTIIDQCIAGVDANGSTFFIVTYIDPCPGNSSGGVNTGTGSSSGTGGTGTGTSTSGTGSSGTGSVIINGSPVLSSPYTGSNTSANETILTTPTPGSNTTGAISNPCSRLNGSTSNNNAYKIHFKNLNTTENLNRPMEYGFSLVGNQYVYSHAVGDKELKTPIGAKNFTHTHPNRPQKDIDGSFFNGNVKMLSPEDLWTLITDCQRNSRPEQANAFGVMISDEGIFALTILEPFVLPSSFKEEFEEFEKDYKNMADKIISDNRDLDEESIENRKEKLQKLMLNGLKKLGLEDKVGLFEGEFDLDKLSWRRKKLNTSGNITDENC